MATLRNVGNFTTTTRSLLRKATAKALCPTTMISPTTSMTGPSCLLIQRVARSSSTASVVDFSDSIRETVKTSILDQATREDSKIWSTPPKRTQHQQQEQQQRGGSINDALSTFNDDEEEDLLDDWSLDGTTRYWPHLPPNVSVKDPFVLTKVELDTLSESIRNDLLGTDHPVLNQAASYFFGSADGGKKVRPMMVVLLSRALADTFQSKKNSITTFQEPNGSHKDKHNDNNTLFTNPLSWQRSDLPQAQRRLAEISEMIHTASLFHDDVIDEADTRRGFASVHLVFGNKMAILAGDYLLARASICLARLRNVEVVETMSTIIEHLVRGEVMQLRGTTSLKNQQQRLLYYLKKNFYKTGSLMANSCKSAALLGNYPQELVIASYKFGKHVGMAFQLVDDVLDFEGSVSSMGKPVLSDLQAGLATAPVLFAAEQYPELYTLMDRKFKQKGDIETAVNYVFESNGIERTKQLARVHAELAMDAILPLNPSIHRDALINLAYKVVSRTK